MTIGRRPGGWFEDVYMLNPVTPIVLIFQRAIYAKLDNPDVPVGPAGPRRSCRTGRWARTSAYLGYSFAFGVVVLAIAICGVRSQRSELRRGALAMAAGDRDPRRLEAVPALPRALLVAEGAGDPLRADPVRGLLAARRHRLRRRGGHDRRHPRPQRLGQVDAAEVRRRHPAAERGRDRHPRPARRAARARRRLPPRADRAREHLHERVDPRAVEDATSTGSSTRSSRSPSSRSSSTCRCGTTRRACTCGSGSRSRSTSIPTSCSSTRCSSVGDEAFQRKCLERVAQFQREGRTILFVTHARRPRAPDLRPGDRARPRRAWSPTRRRAKRCARSARRCCIGLADPRSSRTSRRSRRRPRTPAMTHGEHDGRRARPAA